MNQHVLKSRSFLIQLFPLQGMVRTSSFCLQVREISKVTTSTTNNEKEPLEGANDLQKLKKSNTKLSTQELFKIDLIPMQNELRNHKWDIIIENSSKYWKRETFQALLMNYFLHINDFQSAKAYLNYLKLQSALNAMVLANYVAICGKNNAEKEMLEHLELIPKECYLNHELNNLVTTGLLHTTHWEKALPILKLYKSYHKISNSDMWSKVATKAFRSGDLARGINLLQELYQDKLTPIDSSIEAWIKAISQINDDTRSEKLDNFFEFMRNYQKTFSFEIIESFKITMEEQFNFKSTIVKIPPTSQVCPICNEKLEALNITPKQFKLLREEMEKLLLLGQDVYQNSNPKEINNFKKFLDNAKPYDLVVDGLNVAYRVGGKKKANQLLKVLKYLRYSKKYEILLLGRKHLQKWPKNILFEIHQLSQVYLTDNLSEDDPFLLLAAISGGPNTNFLSVDLMRNHSYKFHADDSLQDLFNTWKKTHQVLYKVDQSGLKIIGPKRIDERCQGNLEKGFHLPCTEIDPLPIFQFWLCLKSNKK